MNNLWETEEERRKRLGLQPLQSTPVNQQPVPQFNTTREAVAYAWDKQHPNGGMAKMTGPLGDISYYDENLHKDEKPQQNGVFGNVLKKGEQLASAGLNGLSLGFADEMEGVMGGLGYGLASLNPKWTKAENLFGMPQNAVMPMPGITAETFLPRGRKICLWLWALPKQLVLSPVIRTAKFSGHPKPRLWR